MRYFTADWHFGHGNIIQYCNRPHANVDNMDDHFVRELQSRLDPEDELWFLGDMSGPRTKIDNLRARLASIPCEIHWIKGNHDPDPEAVSDLAEYHGQLMEMKLDREKQDGHSVRLVLCHYPMRSWNGRYHGDIHLHGHVHGQINNRGRRRGDVGVDTDRWSMAYGGISQKDILDVMLAVPAPKNK